LVTTVTGVGTFLGAYKTMKELGLIKERLPSMSFNIPADKNVTIPVPFDGNALVFAGLGDGKRPTGGNFRIKIGTNQVFDKTDTDYESNPAIYANFPVKKGDIVYIECTYNKNGTPLTLTNWSQMTISQAISKN